MIVSLLATAGPPPVLVAAISPPQALEEEPGPKSPSLPPPDLECLMTPQQVPTLELHLGSASAPERALPSLTILLVFLSILVVDFEKY